MPLILNVDTATKVCSVCVAKNGKTLAVKEVGGDYSHAENLTVFIDEVIKESGIFLNQLDAIAVSKGPGSYTGLRIGVATAKGLCYGLNKPLIAVNTLEALSLHFALEEYEGQFLTAPMLDARRMEVYTAIYNSRGEEIEQTTAKIIDEQSFSELLESNKIIFVGDGVEKCKEVIGGSQNAVYLPDILPSAANMIQLSEKAFNDKRFEDIAYFEPFYLKDFVAGKPKKH